MDYELANVLGQNGFRYPNSIGPNTSGEDILSSDCRITYITNNGHFITLSYATPLVGPGINGPTQDNYCIYYSYNSLNDGYSGSDLCYNMAKLIQYMNYHSDLTEEMEIKEPEFD